MTLIPILMGLAFFLSIVVGMPFASGAYGAGYWLPRLVVPSLLVFFACVFIALDWLPLSAKRWVGWSCLALVVFQALVHVSIPLAVGRGAERLMSRTRACAMAAAPARCEAPPAMATIRDSRRGMRGPRRGSRGPRRPRGGRPGRDLQHGPPRGPRRRVPGVRRRVRRHGQRIRRRRDGAIRHRRRPPPVLQQPERRHHHQPLLRGPGQ